MDAKSNEYYTLCTEFLKLSDVYKRLISEVDDISARNSLPSNFSKLDFSEWEHISNWWVWLQQNEQLFSEDILKEYGDLLYLVYPVFQDVHSQSINLVLSRIDFAQTSKKSIVYKHISDGREYLKEKMDSYLEECEKRNLSLSARDFVEGFCRWMDRESGDIVDLEKDPKDEFNDEFSYIIKVDVRGERNDIINEFRRYQSKSNAKVDSLYRNWERFKRIRSFAYTPVEVKNLNSKRKLLGILQDKRNGMSNKEINKKYNFNSIAANSAKEYVKRAEKIIKNIEVKGEFMLNDS